MKNIEVIDKLQKYFMEECNLLSVCRSLACAMIDFNRLAHIDELPEKEKKLLNLRIKLNADELHKFVEDGPRGTLKLHLMNSDES